MFAALYHAHHSLHPDDLPFWLDLAARQDGPVLELGCGTGRVLLALARAGHRVYGLDCEAAMLAVLHSQLTPELAPRVHTWQGDMAAFRLALAFELVILPCNTLSTLSRPMRLAMLSRVRAHLRPGGIFAASLPNPAVLARLPARAGEEVEESFPHPLDGEPVQVSSAWRRARDRFTLYWYYDHLLPDGRVERVSAAVTHTILPAATYQQEWTAAGLQPLQLLGDFDGSPYTRRSPNLILIGEG